MGRLRDLLDRLIKVIRPDPPVPPPPPPLPPPDPPPDPPDSINAALLNAHNLQRQAKGVGALRLETDLVQAAGKHAVWMATTGRLSHTGSGGSDVARRVRAEGYYYMSAGENIAEGYGDVAAVIEGWMNSSGHRRNILNGQFRDVGFGVAADTAGNLYWCAVFGSRATLAIAGTMGEVTLGGALHAKSEPSIEERYLPLSNDDD